MRRASSRISLRSCGLHATHRTGPWVRSAPAFLAPSVQVRAERRARLGQIMSRECGCVAHKRCHKFSVTLAKARTHYPKSQLLRDAGATAFLTNPILWLWVLACGYGFWLSPGRRQYLQRRRNRLTVVRAKAGTHYHRSKLLCTIATTGPFNTICCGIWVPAFAGTTAEGVTSTPAARSRIRRRLAGSKRSATSCRRL
ncbi:hypothetical protein ACVL91_001013 [Bradyrhizobium elkanii]|uniref:Uncharacterized protein n=1 Tax=Bradyrhizobium elkanii TaxID=29448 RepID=A0A8I1YB15_BRAEL|nr:hypothetical protein [Bradyrhizobium elkanii]